LSVTGKADHKGFWAKRESAGAPRSAFNSPQLTIQDSSVSNARNCSKNHHKRVLIGNRPDSGCFWLKVLKVQTDEPGFGRHHKPQTTVGQRTFWYPQITQCAFKKSL